MRFSRMLLGSLILEFCGCALICGALVISQADRSLAVGAQGNRLVGLGRVPGNPRLTSGRISETPGGNLRSDTGGFKPGLSSGKPVPLHSSHSMAPPPLTAGAFLNRASLPSGDEKVLHPGKVSIGKRLPPAAGLHGPF